MPVTCPAGPTRVASAGSVAPCPQPTSRTVEPGLKLSRSSPISIISRRSVANRSKNSMYAAGSPVASTLRKFGILKNCALELEIIASPCSLLGQSTVAPDALTARHHLSPSLLMSVANSSGELLDDSNPCSESAVRIAFVANAFFVSALRSVRTSLGVPRGATNPNQTLT